MYDDESDRAPSGPQTTFVEKAPRQFLCGDCGRIETMGKTAWNRYKNTGSARMVCSCGAWGDVNRSDAAAAPAPAAPAPTSAKAGEKVDLNKADLSQLFGGAAQVRSPKK